MVFAPPSPTPKIAGELVALVEQLAAELERDECEVARVLAEAYRRHDKGAEASRWSWAWLLRSTVAPVEAARLLTRAEVRRRVRSTPPPAPVADRSAAAAAAAAVARAAGGAR